MSELTGDKITQRALAPLPDLSTIVFFRKANRDFVTGRGPFIVEASRGVRKFIRWGMWVLLAAGLGMSIVVGAIEIYLHQQRAALEASLVTVYATVMGCDNTATSVPHFLYKANGKTYEHYAPQTLAGMCDDKAWQITYIPGDPDKFAVAPDSPLPEADDDLDFGYLVGGPALLIIAIDRRRRAAARRTDQDQVLFGRQGQRSQSAHRLPLQGARWPDGGQAPEHLALRLHPQNGAPGWLHDLDTLRRQRIVRGPLT